ncbi:MAG: DUF2934 domain-containing protein [Amaricoccus sp.]
MNANVEMPSRDDVARVAHAIWEAEGRPEGCDHEHWTRAKQLLLEGRAEIEYPESAASEQTQGGEDASSLRKPAL